MAMKILFDAINPKHCRIAAAVYQTLKDEYEIFVTTRDYAENKQILNANAIPYFTLGGYYTTIWSKFLGRVDRCNWLTRHVQDNGIDFWDRALAQELAPAKAHAGSRRSVFSLRPEGSDAGPGSKTPRKQPSLQGGAGRSARHSPPDT